MDAIKHNQQVLYSDTAREKLSQGLNMAATAVGSTLGAGGRNVLISKSNDEYHITKDGVTVVRSLQHPDPIINTGLLIARDVAEKTVNETGDGTTSSVVLANAIYTTGLRTLSSKLNPIEIKKGLDLACKTVTDYLDDIAIPINTLEDITNVALVSTNGDELLSNTIAKIFHKSGADTIIDVKSSSSINTYAEEADGLQFDRGYISHGFLNDPTDKQIVLDKPYVLLTDQKISNIELISGIFEKIGLEAQENNIVMRPLLIIAEDVDNEALTSLIMNKQHYGLKVCCVKAPDFGIGALECLYDMAALTIGKVITKTTADSLLSVELNDLGIADKVVITRDTTTIKCITNDAKLVDDQWFEETIDNVNTSIKNRIDKLVKQQNNYNKATDLVYSSSAANDRFKLSKLKKRIASLQNGLTTLYVGGISEVEVKERIDRADDAIGSVKAALYGGIIPGGGVALLRSTKVLKLLLSSLVCKNKNIAAGVEILLEAVELPARLILQNATGKSELILSKILNSKSNTRGFDVKNHVMCDLMETGIVDPVRVTKSALINAVSIAGSLLTTECVVSYNLTADPLMNA